MLLSFFFFKPSLTSPFLGIAQALRHVVSQGALWPLTVESWYISVITAVNSPGFPYGAARKCLFLDVSAYRTCWLDHIKHGLSDLADVAVSFGGRRSTYLNFFFFIFPSQLKWQIAEHIGLWFIHLNFSLKYPSFSNSILLWMMLLLQN